MNDQQTQRPGRGWQERAACRDVDPELFFPTPTAGPAHRMQVAAAKAVCAGCPVREACLAEALARIPYGIAGGLTEQERQQLRRTRRTIAGEPAAVARRVHVTDDSSGAGSAGLRAAGGAR